MINPQDGRVMTVLRRLLAETEAHKKANGLALPPSKHRKGCPWCDRRLEAVYTAGCIEALEAALDEVMGRSKWIRRRPE